MGLYYWDLVTRDSVNTAIYSIHGQPFQVDGFGESATNQGQVIAGLEYLATSQGRKFSLPFEFGPPKIAENRKYVMILSLK
jgi:hypothetical protein